jgi:ABC-2 type transport system permease protein
MRVRLFSRMLRAELIKARSGPTLLSMFSFVIVTPLLVVYVAGVLDEIDFTQSAAATRTLLAVGVSGALGCAFFGSYLVTRDYYYRAMDRSFVTAPTGVVFAARMTAAAISGLLFAVGGLIVWTSITVYLVADHGGEFALQSDSVPVLGGYLLAGTLAGVIGCGVGWLVRDYYAAVLVLLVAPAVVGVPMLSRVREVERFLPVGASAGLGDVSLDGLLSQGLAGLVMFGWAMLAGVGGWLMLRSRRTA